MFSRKALTGAAAALALGGALVVASSPAEAQWRRGGGWGPGAVVGGLAAGAIIGGALASRPYYGGGYYAPAYAAPVYGPAPVYSAAPCWRERRPAYDAWGNFAGYRMIRVCN